MTAPNYYKILQVDREASREVIEKAYKALARKYHPDTGDSARARELHDKMRLLNEAYSVLSNPKKRAAYDRELKKRLWEVFLEDGLVGLYRELR